MEGMKLMFYPAVENGQDEYDILFDDFVEDPEYNVVWTHVCEYHANKLKHMYPNGYDDCGGPPDGCLCGVYHCNRESVGYFDFSPKDVRFKETE